MPATAVQGLRIVLAGMPAAGKSALLGALAQAAETQSNVLGSKLDAASDQLLDPLQQETYENKLHATAEEIHPFPVTFETSAGPIQATLIDSGGQGAQDLLTGKQEIDAKSGLARAIQSADTLLLVVDAAAKPVDLEKDFQRLAQFLRLFEQDRAGKTEIGGLPVYIVLSKCDQLARQDDSAGKWVQRIEEGKRIVAQRFHDFLAEQEGRDQLPFGTIDLHLWATAVKRPALSDRASRPNEPYGVAELFRQCLDSAQSFRARSRRAQQRMVASVSGVLALAFVLAMAVTVFFMTRPNDELARLESAVREALPGNNSPTSVRFGKPQDRITKLTEIERNPYFTDLPAKQREEVRDTLRELTLYQSLDKEFQPPRVPGPMIAKSDDDLAKIEKGLKELAIPPEYISAWSATPLAHRQAQYRRDLDLLRTAINEEEGWIKSQVLQGSKLLENSPKKKKVSSKEAGDWLYETEEFLGRKLRHGYEELLTPARISYARVYAFKRVNDVMQAWQKVKERLRE